MRTVLLICGSLLLPAIHVAAQSPPQSVTNATGGSYSGGFYQVDWSVGELALVNEMRAGNGQLIITNGFLQPAGLTATNKETRFSDDEIRVRPNITDDKVEITLLTRQQGAVRIEVYDVHGKALFHRTLVSYGTGHTERIRLHSFAAGTYFLKIDLNPAPGSVKKTGSYKIVKL